MTFPNANFPGDPRKTRSRLSPLQARRPRGQGNSQTQRGRLWAPSTAAGLGRRVGLPWRLLAADQGEPGRLASWPLGSHRTGCPLTPSAATSAEDPARDFLSGSTQRRWLHFLPHSQGLRGPSRGSFGVPLERDAGAPDSVPSVPGVRLSRAFLSHCVQRGRSTSFPACHTAFPLWGYLGSQSRWIKGLIPRPLPKACFLTHVPSAAF